MCQIKSMYIFTSRWQCHWESVNPLTPSSSSLSHNHTLAKWHFLLWQFYSLNQSFVKVVPCVWIFLFLTKHHFNDESIPNLLNKEGTLHVCQSTPVTHTENILLKCTETKQMFWHQLRIDYHNLPYFWKEHVLKGTGHLGIPTTNPKEASILGPGS